MRPNRVDQLMKKHTALAYHIAATLHQRLGSEFDLDEINSWALVGLAKAAKRFSAKRGYKFSTFASPRITGEILDCVRQRDNLDRKHRRNVTQGKSVDVKTVSFPPEMVDGNPVEMVDDSRWTPFYCLMVKDMYDKLREILTYKQFVVLDMHFKSGFTLKQIGVLLGVSRCTIGTIKHRAIERLRLKYKEARGE